MRFAMIRCQCSFIGCFARCSRL